MRRLSWRSVPSTYRPPASITPSPSLMSTPRPAMLVAIVIAPVWPASSMMCGLALVLLGVEHVVRHAVALEQAREHLADLDRHGADEHRLALLVALDDVVDDGGELLLLGREDEVVLVEAHHGRVGRDLHDLEPVDLAELVLLGLGRTGHAGQHVVHAEVVLQGDRRERLVLLADRHLLLGLDGLVQALGVPPALEDAAGELVDDEHLAVLDHVLDVLLVQGLRRAAPG